MDDRDWNEGDNSRNWENLPQEEMWGGDKLSCLWMSLLKIFFSLKKIFFFNRYGYLEVKSNPPEACWLPYESAGHEQFRQSKWARAVFGHTHFAHSHSDFFFNHLYATWCLTAELASKTAPFHLHHRGLRLPGGITSLQLFYWTQLD